jgi:hypothetical protein
MRASIVTPQADRSTLLKLDPTSEKYWSDWHCVLNKIPGNPDHKLRVFAMTISRTLG